MGRTIMVHYAVSGCNPEGKNPEGARMLLLHPDFNSANATQVGGETALSWAVICRAKELLIELVKHESVSLDLREGSLDERYLIVVLFKRLIPSL